MNPFKGLSAMITSMIFFPEKNFPEKPEDYGMDFEEVTFTTRDRVKLYGWYLETKFPSLATILFFHGNAGNISHRLEKAKGWLERGFSVFLIDYRGYGKSEGEITHEKDVLSDAEAALHWLMNDKRIPLSRIILYGESLGSFPAIRMASEYKTAGIILEAPFTSLVELAATHYPFVPKAMLKNFMFSNIDVVENLKSPLFIIHGTEDEICPYRMSGELIDHAPEPKGFLSIPGGMHNDLPMAAGEDFWKKPCEFVSKHLS